MPKTLKRLLEEITKPKAPGPSPSFQTYHIVLVLERVATKPIGRKKLAASLKVGEGTLRTILDRLVNAELIKSSKEGCFLTKKGLSLWNKYKLAIRKTGIEKNELTNAEHCFAVLIKKQGDKIESGIEQRDAAVKAGAKGATTILFKKGRFTIPSVSDDVEKQFPKAAKQLKMVFKPEEDDVIIVCSADSPEKAELGVLAAAWTVLDD
ncbi:MAG: DUF4443 domain-containing protein [Candidatus Bathyarchaeia archaeon]